MEFQCIVDCEEEESLEYCQIYNEDNQENPTKFVPPCHVYSSGSPCFAASGSSNVVSKKVRAHKFSDHLDESGMMLPQLLPSPEKPPIISVYHRRPKHLRTAAEISPPLFDSLSDHADVLRPIKDDVLDSSEGCNGETSYPNRSIEIQTGLNPFSNKNVDDSVCLAVEMNPQPKRLKSNSSARFSKKRKHSSSVDCPQILPDSSCTKYWVRLKVIGVDPKSFVGLKCKVFWPLDDEWYFGCIHSYNLETNRHNVEYEDGDKEDIIIGNENIEFFLSRLDMKALNLISDSSNASKDALDFDEMTALAFTMDDFQGLEPGDVIWAKLTGYSMWPAIVVDKGSIMQLFQNGRRGSISVQFFGTHDYARVKKNHVISFLKGLLSSFHLKCKKPQFVESLKEAKLYLSEQRLPTIMLRSHVPDMAQTDGLVCSTNELYGRNDSNIIENMEDREHQTVPFKSEDLEVLCLGKIVEDSNHFHDESSIWPEGYTAVRKFLSLTGSEKTYLYKMQVLRDAKFRNRPIFRVTLDSGVQFEGSTPSSCWKKIYEKIKRRQEIVMKCSSAKCEEKTTYPSGSDMFGFSNPIISKLIQDLSESRMSSNLSISNLAFKEQPHVDTGYRPVHIQWKDLDKCNVCHMDEEYENNLFLQCDRCRIMVHSRCYGESERVNGILWLCNLCRPEAPRCLPTCCLCPVIGGAMKPTTDGRWAHLACAIWIPETCLLDIKKMEPIDGVNGVHKGRWKLLCSICGVPYGACIQCSNGSCRVAYHPLCARAAGLCVEPEDEDKSDLSVDDDVDNHCIRLLSFCKKHSQLGNKRHAADGQMLKSLHECSKYTPPPNLSGCARTEPYNHSGRRGRKEPEDLAAAPLKRLFVEDRPSLVRGCCRQELLRNSVISGAIDRLEHSICFHKSKVYKHHDCGNILSQTEQYELMKMTYRKRLTFGKSSIHGFGVFANQPVKGGDMVIEYSGELVRPSVADRREKFIYNSLVGAGTYMFRIDDDRVIDATRAGSIAHLINHSCEPNCYSRVVSVNGEDHIVICSKRDIRQWEELTYDYRFFSIDEMLSCYCGFPSCRGVVNDADATTRLSRLLVSRRLLVDCCSE